MTRIAVLGLGEAGRLYAEGLATAGATVCGYDPFVTTESTAFQQYPDLADAVRDADAVISLVGAKAAETVAESTLSWMSTTAVYADFNTCSPATKRQLALNAAKEEVLFTDVAVLAPVPRAGSRTPLMASGTGTNRFNELVKGFGVPVETVDGEAGVAASRKLLRSVFMKGLAALVLESVEASRAAGSEDWLREQMAVELGPDAPDLIERLISGTKLHAVRREHEMRDVLDYLHELQTPDWMTKATINWLSDLAGKREENVS